MSLAFTTVSTSLDGPTLGALLAQCERTGRDLSVTIANALASWLANQGAADLPPADIPEGCRGYQWKSLFLPEGTVLRS